MNDIGAFNAASLMYSNWYNHENGGAVLAAINIAELECFPLEWRFGSYDHGKGRELTYADLVVEVVSVIGEPAWELLRDLKDAKLIGIADFLEGLCEEITRVSRCGRTSSRLRFRTIAGLDIVFSSRAPGKLGY